MTPASRSRKASRARRHTPRHSPETQAPSARKAASACSTRRSSASSKSRQQSSTVAPASPPRRRGGQWHEEGPAHVALVVREGVLHEHDQRRDEGGARRDQWPAHGLWESALIATQVLDEAPAARQGPELGDQKDGWDGPWPPPRQRVTCATRHMVESRPSHRVIASY